MTPGSTLIDQWFRLAAASATSHERPLVRPGALRALLGSRTLAWALTLLVTGAAVAGGLAVVGGRDDTIAGLRAQLGAATAELKSTAGSRSAGGVDVDALKARMGALREQIASLRASKTRTVVKERTVTKTVTKWIPNGDGVRVEVTGFEGMIEVRDVQITHSYGYTDLIGIAVNTSGQTLSYAQLGCSFLDADGKVLANEIDNKQGWLPDQTWGFDCSGQVSATGGILRVDELG
jgi:hypothetical protein